MRQAADELRAELAGDTVTFVVNRNINVSNVCIVGCAFCGFGQGKRSPDAYEHDREEFVRRVRRGRRLRRDGDLHAVGHPSRLDARRLPLLAAPGQGDRAADSICTPTARWRSRTCATSRACRRRRSSRGCATPAWTRRRARRPRSCTTACASASAPTSCRSRAGCEIIEASHAAGLRSTATVMFGHIEEPWELAEHMRVVRDAAGAHRRHHRVRAAVVHPLPHAAGAHARGRGDLARGEPQAHRRLPPGARAARSPASRRRG